MIAKHPQASIETEQLDVSSSESIKKFVAAVADKYKHVDVLVNNAGIAWKGDTFNSEVVQSTFATNLYGTIELSESMIPLLNNQGKIVTVGSMMGKYHLFKNSEEWKAKFSNPSITKEQLLGYLHEFEEAVKKGDYAEKGFPKSAYGMSKLGVNIYTMRILSQRQDVKDKHIQVYAQCPGYVNTDMSSHKGPLTIEEGARTTVFLVELPFEVNPDFQGQFFERSALSSLG